MIRLRNILFLIVFLLLPATGNAYDLARHVTEFRLSNGMRWIFVKRAQAPVFSGVVMIRVGGADEEPGKTGLAHVFEHMAFKGSSQLGTRDWAKEEPLLRKIEEVGATLTAESMKPKPDASLMNDLGRKLAQLEREADGYRAKNEIWEVLTRNGAADLNAYTSKDVTTFHASMPSNRFGLWAEVMTDMVFEPAFREFYTERSVIAEERRSHVENNPDGMMSEKILSASFDGGPYHWSTIGFEEDILGLTIDDARTFHAKYYVPGNMVGVLVGDLDISQARAILERTFGRYRTRSTPPGPKSPGKERGDVEEIFAFKAEPSVAVAWHKPTLPDPDEYAFDLIESLLCDGRSSRLQKRLIYDRKMAGDLSCTVAYPGGRLSNLFLVWIDPLRSVAPEHILAVVGDEMRRLRDEPVGEEELASAKKRATAGLVFALDRNMSLAQQLAEFETIFGDWRIFADYPRRIAAVTPADLQRTAARFLTDANRVVIERRKGGR